MFSKHFESASGSLLFHREYNENQRPDGQQHPLCTTFDINTMRSIYNKETFESPEEVYKFIEELFWHRGATYSDEIPFPNEESDSIKTETEPETIWWVQVQDKNGKIGWTQETDHFDHMDACE